MSDLLERWLDRATKDLSLDSSRQVCAEIGAHYESACEEALASGTSEEESDRAAVASLGDPASANRAYKKVLLTSSEAALLRQTRWGIKFRSRRWPWLVPGLVLIGAICYFATGDRYFGGTLLTGGVGMALLASACWLPVYTPTRGRIFRIARFVWLAVLLALTMRGMWWMLISCAWPLVWLEWRLASLRRKLPVSQWPKQLYL